jgi:hypothetical protein
MRSVVRSGRKALCTCWKRYMCYSGIRMNYLTEQLTDSGSLRGLGFCGRSCVPPKVFYIWDFPICSTVQHPSCTAGQGFFAVLPSLLFGNRFVGTRATDIQIYSTGLRSSSLEAANVHVKASYKGCPCLSILGHMIKISCVLELKEEVINDSVEL